MNLDSSIIKEDDMDTENMSQVERVDVEERKTDFVNHVNQKMVLPPTKTEPAKTTSKTDKRMLDESGNMITVEVPDANTTLQMMAKKHLGNEAFWVYFFDVNRDKLSVPEDIRAGMKLYIPNPEFFGFSADNPATVQYARHRAEEIMSKQKKE